MLRGLLLVLASTSSLVTAYCAVNANKTDCATAVDGCMSKCRLYQSQNSCKAALGCNWTIDEAANGLPFAYCHDPSLRPFNCVPFDNITACEENSMCGWSPRPCVFWNLCRARNSSADPDPCIYDDPNCEMNPDCELRQSCPTQGKCDHVNQSSCVAEAGCYWSEVSDGKTLTGSSCNECFTDFTNTESNFLAMQARVGRVCSVPKNSALAFKVLKVVPSATGCSGGEPSFSIAAYSVCDPPLGVESNSLPTNKLSSALVMISSIITLLLAN